MDCPLCTKTAPLEAYTKLPNGQFYHHCNHCDLVFLDPDQRLEPGAEEERYRQHNNSAEDHRYITYLMGFHEEAVTPYLSPPARVLDFGSGPGPVYSSLLRELGYQVLSFDPFFTPEIDQEEALHKERGYDAIIAIEVAEHLYHPGRVFGQLSQALKPGGLIILRTLLHPEGREAFASWWYRRDNTHVSFYSRHSMEYIAQMNGLEIVDILNDRCTVMRSGKKAP